MSEEIFDMPKPPEEPSELLEEQKQTQKKLQRKAQKWKIIAIIMVLITIGATVAFVVLYIDRQAYTEYLQYQYDRNRKEIENLEKQWDIIEKCDYIGENYAIQITDLGNGKSGVISDYDMIAEDMMYMTIKYTIYLVGEDATWENPIYIDVVNADGTIPTKPEQDHCARYELSETTGTSKNMWFGWGNENPGSLNPGLYVILFYEGDKIIQRQEIILK